MFKITTLAFLCSVSFHAPEASAFSCAELLDPAMIPSSPWINFAHERAKETGLKQAEWEPKQNLWKQWTSKKPPPGEIGPSDQAVLNGIRTYLVRYLSIFSHQADFGISVQWAKDSSFAPGWIVDAQTPKTFYFDHYKLQGTPSVRARLLGLSIENLDYLLTSKTLTEVEIMKVLNDTGDLLHWLGHAAEEVAEAQRFPVYLAHALEFHGISLTLYQASNVPFSQAINYLNGVNHAHEHIEMLLMRFPHLARR